MKRLLLLILLCISQVSVAQVFPLETIMYHGDIRKHINLVILGDGFTASEQDSFIYRAKILTEYYFKTSPWSNYINYYNVFAIKVVSAESGAKHPCALPDCPSRSEQPLANPNNYFGSTFDSFGLHRLVVGNSGKVAAVLDSSFPYYNQAVVLVNTPYYGGSGGEYTFVTCNKSSAEIFCHETAHSFAGLGDEYWAGETYAREKPNMTAEHDSAKVKWRGWMQVDKDIGVFQFPGQPWYKPGNNCKMQQLGKPFCCVCSQAIIEKIHSITKLVLAYSPSTPFIETAKKTIDFRLDTLLKPVPNTLKTVWSIDGRTQITYVNAVRLSAGKLDTGIHVLTADVQDTSTLLICPIQPTEHFTHVKWVINNDSVHGIQVNPSVCTIVFTVDTRPNNDTADIVLKLSNTAHISLELYNNKDSLINTLVPLGDHYSQIKYLDMQNLATGIYDVRLTIDGIIYRKQIIKE